MMPLKKAYTPGGGVVKSGGPPAGAEQESMETYLTGLNDEKKLAYLLWKIGELTGREGLSLGNYWPQLGPWEQLDRRKRERVLRALGREAQALELLEEKNPGRARWGYTMRDKLLLYIEAIGRMSDYPDEQLDRPCTWEEFRAAVSKEIEHGKG